MNVSRQARIMMHKSGGNSTGTSYRICLPTSWCKAMGITQDIRTMNLQFVEDENKIILSKSI